MSKSIRYYYFTSIATVLVASVLVMGLVQIWITSTYFRQEEDTALTQVTTGVVSGLQTGQIRLEDDSILTVEYIARISDVRIFITDAEGRVAYSSAQAALPPGAQVPPAALRRLAAQGQAMEVGNLGGFFARDYYTKAEAITGAGGEVTGYVFAASDASGLRLFLSDIMSSFILSAALVLFVASLLALVLANRTVIPIRRLSAAARQFGEGNYSARVPVEGDDELSQLAITFNEMANSFEATDSSRRSFMGNIAHELRTPMTTIKGFIDGMLDGTIPEDQRDKYLTVVSKEVGRLARLTSNMLDISKLESGEYVPKSVVFDIWQLVTTVFLSSMQRLDEGKIEVRGLADHSPVLVTADEDFVHQILFNLVDNAIKFTGEEGVIEVHVKSAKGIVTVCIRNTGEGIRPEELPQVFDRFYKGDKSRGASAGGSGLGLHICKVLVGLMGGRIWATSETGGWTEFSFTLPAASQRKPNPRAARGGQKPAAAGVAGEETAGGNPLAAKPGEGPSFAAEPDPNGYDGYSWADPDGSDGPTPAGSTGEPPPHTGQGTRADPRGTPPFAEKPALAATGRGDTLPREEPPPPISL